MKQTIFNSDTVNNKILVERAFDAGLELVWQAWTDASILDEWWAPHPWKAVTKTMDFREAGLWLYYMQGPEGEKHWCRADYGRIKKNDMFEQQDSFCDEEGKKNEAVPSMHWNVAFSATASGTKVNIVVSFQSKADMDTIMSMGFKEGFASAHGNLDELLKKQVSV